MDLIKYLDFFSIRFSFYTNNQPSNQSIFGGVMTVVYIFVCLIAFLFLSYEDLKKLNPITTISEIPDTERKLINMNQEKLWIPFRMVNYENKFIDHRGILYIVPYLIEGRFDEKIGMNLNYTLLKYKLCNETSMVNMPSNYKISLPLNQLFCIDKDDILFGGNWNHDFLNYIEVNLYLCEDGVVYNKSDPRCSKIDNYLKTVNTSLLIDFYFPTIQFQPTNYETPIKIIYRNYYYRLTSYNYKVEKLFIREHVLTDDQDILSTNQHNHSCWAMSSLYSDDYYVPVEDDPISNNSNTSRIYALNIYMDDGIVHYTRSYKKIIIIISNAFPIIKFILYFVEKFTTHVKLSLTKRKLIEILFEDKETQKKLKKNIELLNKKLNNNNKPVMSINKSENELIKSKNMPTSENNSFNNINKNIKLFRNNFVKEKDAKINNTNHNILNNKLHSQKTLKVNKELFIDETNNRNRSDNGNDKNNKPEENHHINKYQDKEKYIFPKYYYLLDIVFDNLIRPKEFLCISKAYFTVYNFMCQIYDISTHLILFKQFNLLNNMLKGKFSQEIGFSSDKIFNKININDEQIINKLCNDFKNNNSILYSNYFL